MAFRISRFKKLLFVLIPIIGLLSLYHLEANKILNTEYTSSWGKVDFSYLKGFLVDDSIHHTNSTLNLFGYKLEANAVAFKFTNPLAKPLDKKEEVLAQNIETYEDFMSKEINEPKDVDIESLRPPSADAMDSYQRANATIVSLVRNNEYRGIIKTIVSFEKNFNSKFKYPYTFINDEEFSDKFKEHVGKHVSDATFVTIPKELWEKPSSIDLEKEAKAQDLLAAKDVAYAKKGSYHNMCRFYSGNFYNVAELQKYKYYWRIEPNVNFFSELNYDVFKYLEKTGKLYGFNINLYDIADSVESLWPETLKWLNQGDNYKHVSKHGAFNWLLDSTQDPDKIKKTGYSTCHFWSNFEIADMDFYRGEAYNSWFQHLDSTGGFYYERWGDAPVHSIGLALFANRKQIHYFRDIGYFHDPYQNCPNTPSTKTCKKGEFSKWKHLYDQNCAANFVQLAMDEDDLNIY